MYDLVLLSLVRSFSIFFFFLARWQGSRRRCTVKAAHKILHVKFLPSPAEKREGKGKGTPLSAARHISFGFLVCAASHPDQVPATHENGWEGYAELAAASGLHQLGCLFVSLSRLLLWFEFGMRWDGMGWRGRDIGTCMQGGQDRWQRFLSVFLSPLFLGYMGWVCTSATPIL